MWGVAIGYLIIGSALYKFRTRLNLIPSIPASKIGQAFWWAGWAMLVWWVGSSIVGVPTFYKTLVAAFGTLFVGLRALRITSKYILRSP